LAAFGDRKKCFSVIFFEVQVKIKGEFGGTVVPGWDGYADES
jgi:hypothetical protein